MNSDTAMVEITSGSTPCLSMGSTMMSLNTRPRSRSDSAMPMRMASQNGVPRYIASRMKNAGTMTNSPWAKLIVCDVCHSSVKPTAIRA